MSGERVRDTGSGAPPATGGGQTLGELGCELKRKVGEHLQWIVHEAATRDGPLLAWAFAPSALRDAPDLAGRPLASMAQHRAYAPLAERAEAAALRLRPARDPLLPILRVTRSGDGLLWMTTPFKAPPGRVWRVQAGIVLALARRLGAALEALHERDVLHLDLCPELAVGHYTGSVELQGFGIDVRTSLPHAAQTNRALGRPGFSAPELWDPSARSALGPWTDVYGASAVCAAWLTGRTPEDFRTRLADGGAGTACLADTLRNALSPADPSHRRFIDGIVSGLEPCAVNRPQTMAEWIASLGHSESGRASEPAPPPPAPPVPPAQAAQAAPPAWAARAAPPAPSASGTASTPYGEPIMARPDRYSRGRRADPALRRRNALARLAVVIIAFLLMTAGIVYLAGQFVAPDQAGPAAATPAAPAPGAGLTRKAAAVPERPGVDPGTIFGQPYRDDPDRLEIELADRALPIDPNGPASSLLGYFSSSPTACASPLRVHLRADGEGLLIVRPAGLVWVTAWDTSRSGRRALAVKIVAVQGRSGPMDVPGLVGSARSIEASDGRLRIGYLGSPDRAAPETFVRCAGRAE